MLYSIMLAVAKIFGFADYFEPGPIVEQFEINFYQSPLEVSQIEELTHFRRYETSALKEVANNPLAELIDFQISPQRSLKALVQRTSWSNEVFLAAHNGLPSEQYAPSLKVLFENHYKPLNPSERIDKISIEVHQGPIVYSSIEDMVERAQNDELKAFIKRAAQRDVTRLLSFKIGERTTKLLVYEPAALAKKSGYVWIVAHNIISEKEQYLPFVIEFLREFHKDKMILYAPSNFGVNLAAKKTFTSERLMNDLRRLNSFKSRCDGVFMRYEYPNFWVFSDIDYKVGAIEVVQNSKDFYSYPALREGLVGLTRDEKFENNVSSLVRESGIDDFTKLAAILKNNSNIPYIKKKKIESIIEDVRYAIGKISLESDNAVYGTGFNFKIGNNRFLATSLESILKVIEELTGNYDKNSIEEYFTEIAPPYTLKNVISKMAEADYDSRDRAIVIDYNGIHESNKKILENIDLNAYFDIDEDLVLFHMKNNDNYSLSPSALTFDTSHTESNGALLIGYPAGRLNDHFLDRRIAGKERVLGVKRVSAGRIEFVVGDDEIRHSCATLEGSTGSPLIDPLSGKVLGMHVGAGDKNNTFNKAVSANSIVRLADKLSGYDKPDYLAIAKRRAFACYCEPGAEEQFEVNFYQSPLEPFQINELMGFRRYEADFIKKAVYKGWELISFQTSPQKSLKALVQVANPSSEALIVAHNGLSGERYLSSMRVLFENHYKPVKPAKKIDKISITVQQGRIAYGSIEELVERAQKKALKNFIKRAAGQKEGTRLLSFKIGDRTTKLLVYEPAEHFSMPPGDDGYVWIIAHNILSEEEQYLPFIIEFLRELYEHKMILYSPSDLGVELVMKKKNVPEKLLNDLDKLANVKDTCSSILRYFVYPNIWLFKDINFKVGPIEVVHNPMDSDLDSDLDFSLQEGLVGLTDEEKFADNVSLVVSENGIDGFTQLAAVLKKKSDIPYIKKEKIVAAVDKAQHSIGKIFLDGWDSVCGTGFTFTAGNHRFLATSFYSILKILSELTKVDDEFIKKYFEEVSPPYTLKGVMDRVADIDDELFSRAIFIDYGGIYESTEKIIENIDFNASFDVDGDLVVFYIENKNHASFHYGALEFNTSGKESDGALLIGYPTYVGYGSKRTHNYRFSGWKKALGVKRVSAGSIKFIGDEIHHSCATLNGSSGSPLIEPFSGKVLGMHVGAGDEKNTYNKAVSANKILRLADRVKRYLYYTFDT